MKYSFALAALAALVVAQDASIIPECARDCLLKATTSATSCEAGDYTCSCIPDNKAKIQATATSCVIAACGADTALNEVIPASDKLCTEVGSGAASSSAAAAPATSAASSSAPIAPSSSPSASVIVPTSAPGSATLPFTSATASLSNIVVTSTQVATTSAAASGNATSTGAGSAATTTTPVQAGAGALAPFGGLAMLVLAALAL